MTSSSPSPTDPSPTDSAPGRPRSDSAPGRPRSGDPAVLRLTRPDDLVEAVPYLLGFHPRRSIVLVGIRGTRQGARTVDRVVVAVRLDMDDVVAVDHATGSARAEQAARGVAGSGAHRVVGVLFPGPEHTGEQYVDAMGRVGHGCESAGLSVEDFLVAPATSALPVAAGRVAAEAIYAGLVARPDRDSLVALLRPDADAAREQHRPAIGRAIEHRRRLRGVNQVATWRRSTVRALYAASRTLVLTGDDQVARFGAALTDTDVRDTCWLALDEGRLDGEGMWRELAQRLPAPYDAAPLLLFGWLRWRAGDGALAGIAAERAMRSDPDYTAATLLDSVVRSGLDPFRTPRLRRGA